MSQILAKSVKFRLATAMNAMGVPISIKRGERGIAKVGGAVPLRFWLTVAESTQIADIVEAAARRVLAEAVTP